MPTRGFEPPHPEGQQILNLSRLPVPPRRHPLNGPDGIIPPILYLVHRTGSARRTGHRHLSHPHIGMAAPDLPGATRPHRRRCDETENPGRSQLPGPLALLPVARSPSRSCHHGRWWALTPPVRPLPVHLGAPAGMLSVAVVVRTRLSPACPHLLFHGATLSRSPSGPLGARDAGQGVGKFL